MAQTRLGITLAAYDAAGATIVRNIERMETTPKTISVRTSGRFWRIVIRTAPDGRVYATPRDIARAAHVSLAEVGSALRAMGRRR